MNNISEVITEELKRVAVVGHVRPDGDCVGSVMGIYHYLTDNYKKLTVTPYLEPMTENLKFMTEGICVREDDGAGEDYDLVISSDASDLNRIGAGKAAFMEALEKHRTVCIDHHVTNPMFADVNHVEAEASSASEVVAGLLDMDKVSLKAATCLYTGIIHDSGVFRFDSTSPRTLRISADLIEKGVPFSLIIQESVSNEPIMQLKMFARVLNEGVLYKDERIFVGRASTELQKELGLTPRELGSVVMYLNYIQEADGELFMYQNEDGSWKGSLRSKTDLDVAAIAAAFGGGGHKKAAGFSVSAEELEDAILKVRALAKEQVNA